MKPSMKTEKATRGEGYIDICILVLVFVSFLAFAVSVGQVFTERINMQQAADRVLEEAVTSGLIKSEIIDSLIAKYQEDGYEIKITKNVLNEDTRAQLGELIYVSVKKSSWLTMFGRLIGEEMVLEVRKEGRSERYWKW